MKKLLIFALVAFSFASCDTSVEPVTKKFEIDPMSTINLKPAKGTQMRVKSLNADNHLTALEIVKQTDAIRLIMQDSLKGIRTFEPLQRDTISEVPMLKMWSTDILAYFQLIDGTYTDSLMLMTDFLEAKNCVLIDTFGDTLAYVPNSVLRSAETQIRELFEAKNYEPILDIFNDAYTFIPITGEEWRELKKDSIQ